MDKTSNFSVDSKGYCFLCLNKIALPPVKLNFGNDNVPSVYSLQDISRYLKIDMRKVFIQGGAVPPHLLAKVKKSRLKVELCEECGFMTENISRHCRQLEKLKMEIESGLESVHEKILETDQTGRTAQFRKATGSDQSSVGGWMEILDVLRMETMRKCSSRINKTSPRLQVQRLTPDEIQRRTFRTPKEEGEEISQSKGMSDSRIIKSEEPTTVVDSWTLDEDEDHCENSFGDDLDCNTGDMVVQDELTAQGEVTGCVTRKREIETGKNFQQKYKINPLTKKYTCLLCSMEYASSRGVNEHYKKIHCRIRFKCKICGNEFTERNTYKVHHQNVHMGVRFQCQGCKKIFSLKNNLRRHQRKAGCASGKA